MKTTEIDNPIERLPPDQLARLGQRVLDVVADNGSPSPLSREELKAIEAAQSLTDAQQSLIVPLAAWISEHRDALASAFPGPLPPFDNLQGFWSNFYQGPRNGATPELAFPSQPTSLLGFSLDFPFGVPACALTPQPDFIGYFARRGFDLLTFKTVRDRPWNPHPFPQWAFVPDLRAPLRREKLGDAVYPTLDPGSIRDTRYASLVNSFGVPSLTVDQWKMDVATSKKTLGSGQVLIVSVMGSPEVAPDDTELVRQFARAAAHAEDAGADIIEVNLSCPNTGGELICHDADLSYAVLSAVRAQLTQDTPILIKISYLAQPALTSLIARCRGIMDGVVAINAVSVSAQYRLGGQFFPGRHNDKAGLSGVAIRDLGLEVTRSLADLRAGDGASSDDWVIIGVGGVVSAEDYEAYRERGADAVQSCSGAWLNHELAAKVRAKVTGSDAKPRRTVRGFFSSLGEAIDSGGVSLLVDEGSKHAAKQ